MLSIGILAAGLVPVLGQKVPTLDCAMLKKKYIDTYPLRQEYRKKKQYSKIDSIITSYIILNEKHCPCSRHYGELIFRKADINFGGLNKRKEALDLFQEKIEQCQNINDSTTLLLHSKKAVYHLRNDEFPSMKKHLDAAIEIGKKTFDDTYLDLFIARNNLGLYYHWKNDYVSALQIHEKNEQYIENGIFIDTSEHISNLNWCVTNALEIDDLSKTDLYKSKLLQLVKGSRFQQDTESALNRDYFDYYLRKGDLVNAEYYFHQIDTSEFNDYTKAIPLIRFLILSGQENQAPQRIQHVENLLNKYNVPPHQFFRINLALEKLRLSTFLDKNFEPTIDQVTTSIHQNYINLINQSPIEQADNTKLITSKYTALINRLISANRIDLTQGVYDKMNNIKNASSGYYTQVQKFMAQTSDSNLKSDFDLYKKICVKANTVQAADSLYLLSARVQNKISDAGIQWHANNSIKDIQKNLKENDVFLDFYQSDKIVGKEQMYLFITEKDGFHFYSYKNILDSLSSQWDAYNYANNGKKNKELYDYLIRPIQKYLANKNNIYISTDGVLNQVAIDILRPSDGSGKDLLGDIYELVYIDNARSIVPKEVKNFDLKQMPSYLLSGGIQYDCYDDKKDAILAINDHKSMLERSSFQYLQGSKREIDLLSTKLKNKSINTQCLTECMATKKSIISSLNDKSINHIHLSTHGYLTNNQSTNTQNYYAYNSNAQLLFAKESISDDPQLSAIEIINQNISDKELVFLAACNTGKGTYMSGFGNASVANAFKKAGAKKVVATLWPIPDDITAELCDHFYDHYLATNDANAAMRYAQKILRAKYSSPEKWAAFRVMN